MHKARNPIKSVERTIEVIEALQVLGDASVSEIADYIDVTKGTAHHHLSTLMEHRYVLKEKGSYKLGFKFLDIGYSVQNRSVLYVCGKDEADNLAEETGEFTHLTTEEHGYHEKVYNAIGKNATRNKFDRTKKVRSDQLHYTASGKSILAHLPESYVEEIIEWHGLPQKTKNTITDKGELYEQLAKIREQGYALNDEEEIMRMRAVGAPILGPGENIIGAISVSGPVSRINDKYFTEELTQRVTNASMTIEMLIDMEYDNQDEEEFGGRESSIPETPENKLRD